MQRLIVGVDGSTGSHHALEWAASIAVCGHCELELLQVVTPHQAPTGDAASQLLERWRHALPSRCASRTVVMAGEPVDTLAKAAEEADADLLVLGSRGAGGFAGLHVGSVLRHLAAHTTVPLAVVPPTAELGVRSLVVGADDSPASGDALRFAIVLAGCLGAPITAAFGCHPGVAGPERGDPRRWKRTAEEHLRRWAAPVEAAGIRLRVRVEADPSVHPPAAVRYALQEAPGSVAVCGTQGQHGIDALALGGARGAPLELVRRTHHAVVLVPPSERAGTTVSGTP